MCCVVVLFTCFIASLSPAAVTAGKYDDGYSPKCKGDIEKLKQTKITFGGKDLKDPKLAIREIDGQGYMLMLPEAAASYTITSGENNGAVKTNHYSLWAAFKCKGDKLELERCRIGRSIDRDFLYIHPRRCFEPEYDNEIGPDDGMVYVCHAEDVATPSPVAEVVPAVGPANYVIKHWDTEPTCFRLKGSHWCGFAPGVVENGCLDDMTLVQKSKVQTNSAGHIIVEKEKIHRSMQLKVKCENKKFTIESCLAERTTTPSLKPGQYHKHRTAESVEWYAYKCPKQAKGLSYDQLLTTAEILALPDPKKTPKELNDLIEVP